MVRDDGIRIIRSAASSAAARRTIRRRLRSPFLGFTWAIGLTREDIVVGLVVLNRFRARPIVAASDPGRWSDSLFLRGRVIGRADGGCEVRLVTSSSYAFRAAPMIMLGVAVLLLVAYIETGTGSLLPLLAAFGGGTLLSIGMRRFYRSMEPSERALLAAWVDELADDLEHVRSSAPESPRARPF